MKYTVIALLRRLGILEWADKLKYWIRRVLLWRSNRRFVREHPDFPVSPADLAYDAYNHCNWQEYHDVGLAHAGVFAQVIDRECSGEELAILEWGCGPGRLIRHLQALLPNRTLALTGTDYNEQSIAWCRDNLPGIEFVHNELMPPLDLADDRFDVAYNFSVFTHLSESAQKAWVEELHRVLKPGGLLICTTHGDHYRYLLTRREERERYERGEVVVQGNYGEGKKWFFAVHPERFVRDVLLKAFEDVRRLEVSPDTNLHQDVWVARKPAKGGLSGFKENRGAA